MLPSSSLFHQYSKLLTDSSSTTSSSLSRKQNTILEAQKNSSLYDSSQVLADPLKKPKEEKAVTLGKGWFNLEPMKIDEKMQQDLDLIRMRNYLDPKRFYKNPDKMTNVLHIGTVVEGATEYKTSRLSRRERKQTILEEVLADSGLKSYNKKTFLAIQEEKSKKQKMFKSKKKTKY